MIRYQIEKNLSPEEFIAVLRQSTLGERRPIDDFERIKSMLEHADLIITARDGDKLIGVARSISDFVYCTYLSDLAVVLDYQHQGIGKELIQLTKEATPKATTILLSAPKAVGYYPHIGMTKHEACFIVKGVNDLS